MSSYTLAYMVIMGLVPKFHIRFAKRFLFQVFSMDTKLYLLQKPS